MRVFRIVLAVMGDIIVGNIERTALITGRIGEEYAR
jgi:hypothetical protein